MRKRLHETFLPQLGLIQTFYFIEVIIGCWIDIDGNPLLYYE